MRVVTMKMKNCHVRQQVKAREIESQQEVQEVDFRLQDKVIHIKKSGYIIFKEEQVGALGGQTRYFALTTILTCVRIPPSLVYKSFSVDKLLAAAGPKQ